MKKDIATNSLLMYEDVFADIANVNFMQEECLLNSDDLEAVPTETVYKDLDGTHHKLFRDVLMRVKNMGGCIAFIGYESQTDINNVMPVRNMGYNYTVYMRQIKKLIAWNKEHKNEAYARVLHDDQKLMPVATFVLYFGEKPWEKPLSLYDILAIPDRHKSFWKRLVPDYKICVIRMNAQPEEIRKKYKSDYRIIAEYMAHRKDKKKLREVFRSFTQPLLHVEETLDLLRALSHDKRYEELKEIYIDAEDKEECNSMCLLLDDYWERGVSEGISRGIDQGRSEGIVQGRSEVIRIFIIDNLEEGKTEMQIIGKLQRLFSYDEETAEKYYRECVVE